MGYPALVLEIDFVRNLHWGTPAVLGVKPDGRVAAIVAKLLDSVGVAMEAHAQQPWSRHVNRIPSVIPFGIIRMAEMGQLMGPTD